MLPGQLTSALAVQNALLRYSSFTVSRYFVAWSAQSVLTCESKSRALRAAARGPMAGLKTNAAVPGPSPLQEQLFFVFLLLLMLICFFRAGYGDKTRRPSHAAPLSKRLPHRGLQEQGWRVRKQQEGPPAPRTLQRAATPLVVAVARLLVACLRHLRRRGARWTTAMARQTTRMATPCPTRATERRRRRRVFACQRRSSGASAFRCAAS